MEDKANRVTGVQEGEGRGTAASADAADVVNGPEKDRQKERERAREKECCQHSSELKQLGRKRLHFQFLDGFFIFIFCFGQTCGCKNLKYKTRHFNYTVAFSALAEIQFSVCGRRKIRSSPQANWRSFLKSFKQRVATASMLEV